MVVGQVVIMHPFYMGLKVVGMAVGQVVTRVAGG